MSPALVRRLRAAVLEVRDHSQALMFAFAASDDEKRAAELFAAWRVLRAQLTELEHALAVCELAERPGGDPLQAMTTRLGASLTAVKALRGPR